MKKIKKSPNTALTNLKSKSKNRRDLVLYLGSKFSADLKKLFADSFLPKREHQIEVINSFIEIAEMAVNKTDWRIIHNRYKETRAKYPGKLIDKVEILQYFHDHVTLYKSIGEGKWGFYTGEEFNSLSNTEEQTLSENEMQVLLRLILNCLNFELSMLYNKIDEQLESNPTLSSTDNYAINWTGDKINFVKLIYSLYHSQQINHGEGEITKICDTLKKAFNITISDKILAKNINECDMYSYNHLGFVDTIKEGYNKYLESPNLKRNKPNKKP